MEELLLYLLKSAALVSIFLVVYQLLLRNDTSFQANRHFLLGGLVAAAVLPAVEVTRIVEIPMLAAGSAFPVDTGTSSLPEASFEINWWEIAGGIYAAIAAVLLVRFLLQLLSLYKLIRGGSLTKEGNYRIIRTSEEVSPFSFFRNIVLNPQLHAEEDLRNILEHEKTHASQWHSADVLLANLTTALLWFNPLSWWYRKSLVQNLEYIADRQTVAAVPKNEYQHTLVKLAVANHQPVLANNFYQSLIKKRILMLNKTSNQNPSLWKFGTIVPLLFAFMFVFNVKTEAQVPSGDAEITEISVVISSEAPNKSLDKFVKFFRTNNIDLVFSDIDRNSEGLITNITASVKTASGQTGTYSDSNPDGIKHFGIISNKKRTYFTDSPKIPSKNTEDPLQNIGEHPLFIIKGKEYSSELLEGKVVRLFGTATALLGETVEKKYGSRAKDGVIIIEKGQILEYSDAFKTLDAKDGEQKAKYIWISGNAKPQYLSVSTKISVNTSDVVPGVEDIDASLDPSKSTMVRFEQSPRPVFVLNGEVMSEDFDVNSITPKEIESIDVLKDEKAAASYGAEAEKRGVLIIVTKANPQNSEQEGKTTIEKAESEGDNGSSSKTFFLGEVNYSE